MHVTLDVQRRRTIARKNRRMIDKFLFLKIVNYLRDETTEPMELKKRRSD